VSTFDKQFFTHTLNELARKAGDYPVAQLFLARGVSYFIEKVVESHDGYVVLDVWVPDAAKPIMQSTSQVFVIDDVAGRVQSETVAYWSSVDTQNRQLIDTAKPAIN
jgi:hypothetical protein